MVADPTHTPASEPETAPAEIPLSDPLQVFGALGGPNPTTPITVDYLDQAYARFLEAYPDEAGNDRIRDAARRAHELTTDRARWSIQEDGTVPLIGSAGDTYRVSDDLCTGPPWYNRRARQTTAICKGSIRAGSSCATTRSPASCCAWPRHSTRASRARARPSRESRRRSPATPYWPCSASSRSSARTQAICSSSSARASSC
ncbi:MAG: hypothetical protein HGA45_08220 [Chloroflexales bacterium]|nr:hypothetical protein [Chloroflexales bacterium]